MTLKISVIFPWYNESIDTLKKGVYKVKRYLQSEKIEYEIIISENGYCHKYKPNISKVRYIHSDNSGIGQSIKKAIPMIKYDFFYLLSLEVPYNFTDMEKIIPIYNKYELIVGSKLHTKSIYKILIFRKVVSLFFSFLALLFLNGNFVKDPNGSLFGKSKLLKKYGKHIVHNDFFYTTELIYKYKISNHAVEEVPVKYIKSNSNTSVSIGDGLIYFYKLILLWINK